MTNFEYYKDTIMSIVDNEFEDNFGLDIYGNLRPCCKMYCSDCKFFKHPGRCVSNKFKWLYSEHKKKPGFAANVPMIKD